MIKIIDKCNKYKFTTKNYVYRFFRFLNFILILIVIFSWYVQFWKCNDIIIKFPFTCYFKISLIFVNLWAYLTSLLCCFGFCVWDLIVLCSLQDFFGINMLNCSAKNMMCKAFTTLWAVWSKQRYFRRTSLWHPCNTLMGSCIRKRIRSLAHVFQSGCRWQVVNGMMISIWFDNWMPLSPIVPRLPQFCFSPLETVSILIRDRRWLFPLALPPVVVSVLSADNIVLFSVLFFWLLVSMSS